MGTITANYGAGATGDRSYTQGASTGVGSLSQSFSLNQYDMDTTMGVVKYTHRGDLWKIDALVSASDSNTDYGSEGHPYFSGVGASINQLVIRGSGIVGGDDINSIDDIKGLLPSAFTFTDRAGKPVDGHNGDNYTVSSADVTRRETEISISEAKIDLERSFSARVPVSIKFGASISVNTLEVGRRDYSYAFRPTGTAAERLAGNNALVDPALYKDQGFQFGGRAVRWISPIKLYDLYTTKPEYFVLNQLGAYRTRVNNSRELTETISAGYVRGDIKLLENRLMLVGGVRYERTADEGKGPLNDANAKYVRDGSGNPVLDGTGKPVLITTDPLQAERLVLREREARSKASYDGFFPSLNATYEISDRLLVRFGYARTVGRPNLGLIIPGISVSEPGPTGQGSISVVNTGLKPWMANNYDLSLESYSLKGGSGTISVFQKDIKNFFTLVRTPATAELLELYGVPSGSYLNYDIETRGNGGDAQVKGFEFSYKQDLIFLPTWAKGVQLFVNYTKNRLSGSATADFSDFSGEQLSWGGSLVRPRYVLRFTMSQQGETQRAATSIPGRFNYDGALDRDTFSGEFQLTKNLSIYGQITDFLAGGNKDRALIYDPSLNIPDYVKLDRIIYHGVAVTVGIKGQF